MSNDDPAPLLTAFEALIASLVTLIATLIAVSYLWARVTVISPYALLGFTLATGVVITRALLRHATRELAETIVAFVIAAVIFGWVLSIAGPSLLPPGGGPDLSHHLMLVDFFERHWRLPDASLVPVLAEMTHYTPGVHMVSALTGAWARTDGLHTIYVVIALSVALKCGLVFAIVNRSLSGSAFRIPLAALAVLLCITPKSYFLGSFAHDSFFAQAFAELFAVAMWWSAVVWDQRTRALALWLFAASAAGVFLTWPVFIGAPMVTLIAIVLARFDLRSADRGRALVIALGPPFAIAVIHTIGRVGWLGMAGASGAVLRPSVDAFGVPFLVAAGLGTVVSFFHRPARATWLLLIAIAAQAGTLYLLASARGASTPYMAFKMVYLAIYPLAALAAVGAGVILDRVTATIRRGSETPDRPRLMTPIALALLVLALFVYRKPLVKWDLPTPVVSSDLNAAGKWARANVEAACIDYLVASADTMYWLHLAVLGNPRTSPRMAVPDTFMPDRAVGRWLVPDGLPYAIAATHTLPKEVANDVDVLEQFGSAVVVKRRGPAFCADAQRLAAAWLTP